MIATQTTWRITIDGEDVSNTIVEATCNLNADNGTSDLTISARTDLSYYQNARVEFYLNEELYFTGRLQEPADDQWGEDSEATALGPFKEINEQRFLIRDGVEGADYRGQTLAQALLDISNRTQPKMTQAEILAGEDFYLEGEEVVFALEDKLGESASKLMESASVVGMDLPGWKRRYIPKPTPEGSVIKALGEGDYPYGAFTTTRADRNVYAYVLIYSRLESGEQKFPPVLVPVENEGPIQPPATKVFEVADFAGSYEQALEEATRLAKTFKAGTYAFELSGLEPDSEMYLFERIDVTTTEFRGEGRSEEYEVTYRCLVDDTLTVEIGEDATMSLAGSAVKVRETRIPATNRPERPKSYVLGGPGPPPLFGYTDGLPYVSESLPWASYDVDAEEVVIDPAIAAQYGIHAYYESYELIVEIPPDYSPYSEQ